MARVPAKLDSRASQPDQKLPIRSEYGEDGKLHLHIDSDVVIHYHGDKAETVKGSAVNFVHGDQYEITAGNHHTNPLGAAWYDQIIEQLIESPELRDVLEAKLLLYRDQETKLNKDRKRLSLKERLAERRRRGKCNCG